MIHAQSTYEPSEAVYRDQYYCNDCHQCLEHQSSIRLRFQDGVGDIEPVGCVA